MIMAKEILQDYGMELENFGQKLSLNTKALQKILNEAYGYVTENGSREEALANKLEGEVSDLRKKIDSIVDDVHSVRTDKDRVEREKQKMKQDCDHLSIIISEKGHEKEELKELLTRTEQRREERKQQVEYEDCRHREKITNMEKGMQLFQTHLGLKIQRTRHNTLVFIFTQISRMDPEKEYILELTLEGETYRLINSAPPLPNLRELEDRLNASNNLSGCFVHARKLFQKLED